MRMQSC
jgi:hypothetical protein